MKKMKLAAAVAALLAASVLTACSPRSSMSTLSVESDSEASSIFSLTKVLDLGMNYLVTLDYDNAILQYIDIIQHDPTNKEAYAGLYTAYAAQGKTEEAKQVFQQAQEAFESDADFLPLFLEDAGLVLENGGGNNAYQMLSDQYLSNLDADNSIYAKDVGEAWLEADPESADPYAALGTYYASLDDTNSIEALLKNAEENGVDLNAINTKVETNTDGSYTLTLQIDQLQQSGQSAGEKNSTSGSGEKSTVKVKVEANDNAKTTTQKIVNEVADSAASKVVKESGLTGDAASVANSMAQEALRKGLGGAAPAAGPASSSSTAAAAQPSGGTQGDDPVPDIDWSEIERAASAIETEPAS